MQVARDTMLRELGALSSHPSFAATRLRRARLVALLPILAAVSFLAWRAYRALAAIGFDITRATDDIVRLVREIFATPPRLMVGIACAVSILLTAALTIRASILRSAASDAHGEGTARVFGIVGTVCAAIACAGVAWSVSTDLISLEYRWWIAIGSLAPLYVLLTAIEWLAPAAEGATGWRRLLTAIVWTILVPVATVTAAMAIPAACTFISTNAFSAIESIANTVGAAYIATLLRSAVAQNVANVITSFVGTLITIALVILVTMRVSSLYGDVTQQIRAMRRKMDDASTEGKENAAKAKPEPKVGCLGRVLRWLGLFGDDPSATDLAAKEAESDKPLSAEWLESLRVKADAAGFNLSAEERVSQPHEKRDGGTSPEVDSDELAWLFGGRRPTTDQLAVFQEFQHRWAEHLSAVQLAKYGHDRESHADLLVEVEGGSGDDDVMAACAIFATVARGQRVLILTPDASIAAAKFDAISRRLKSMGFDMLYRVEVLTREGVADWCPPAHAPNADRETSPPDIALCTLESYEQVFFGGAYHPLMLRAFQRSLEVVIVERLDQLVQRDHIRLHLPFVLDKHRLMLRTEHRAMQLLLTTAPVGARPQSGADRALIRTAPRRKLAERFFGGDGGLDAAKGVTESENAERRAAHAQYLRPRSGKWPSILILRADRDALADVRTWVVQLLLEEDDVAVVASAGGETKAKSALEFRNQRRSARVTTVDSFFADRESLLEVKWFIIDDVPAADELCKIATHVGAIRGARLIVVAPEGVEIHSPAKTPEPTFSVFPTASSPALFIAHLRGAASVLAPNVPNRREDFARFGLEWDESRWRRHARALTPRLLQENWSLELDGSLTDLVRRETEVWPAVIVRHEEGVQPLSIDLHAPVSAGLCLLPFGPLLRIGAAPEFDDPRRYATWMTGRGLNLGRTDLAFFRPVRFDATRQAFRAINIESRNDGAIIAAEPTAEDGGDFIIPVRQTRFNLPPDMELEGPFALRSLNAFLFRMHEVSAPCVSTERIVAVTTCATGHQVAQRRSIAPIEFSLHIGVTILSIGGTLPSEGVEPILRARFEGRWDSTTKSRERPCARDAWHGLSRVLTYALGEVAPSLLQFTNAYAFRPPRGCCGATVLFIEPAATKGTAQDALATILDDPLLRARLFKAFERAAREGLRSPTATRIDGDEVEDIASSTEELLGILELLRSGPVAPIDFVEREGESTDAQIQPPNLSLELETPTDSSRAIPTIATSANHRWRDINAATFIENEARGRDAILLSPEYGVLLDITEEVATAATTAYGWHDGLSIGDKDALRKACVLIEEVRGCSGLFTRSSDYEAMIAANVDLVRPIAERILSIADASGLTSTRARVGLIASMVQSFEYSIQREGDVKDEKDRMGVQMPLETLFARKGDCDSVSVLIVCLLRSVSIARAGVVLIEEPDGGHAMAAVDCPAVYGDSLLTCRFGQLVIIEGTTPRRLGFGSSEYYHRHVRLLAFR